MNDDNDDNELGRVFTIIGIVFLCVVATVAVSIGGYAVAKGVGRSQARADALNRVRVSSIEILEAVVPGEAELHETCRRLRLMTGAPAPWDPRWSIRTPPGEQAFLDAQGRVLADRRRNR